MNWREMNITKIIENDDKNIEVELRKDWISYSGRNGEINWGWLEFVVSYRFSLDHYQLYTDFFAFP